MPSIIRVGITELQPFRDIHNHEVDEKAVYDIHLTDGRCADVGGRIDDARYEERRREDDKAHKTESEKAEKAVVTP